MKTTTQAAGAFSIPTLAMPFAATLKMPGSKSHANRAIVLAALSSHTTLITNATPCDDVELLVRGLKLMGYQLEWQDHDAGTLLVKGGVPKHGPSEPVAIDCDNAGTTVRFLTSVASITPGHWVITGSERMQQRPIGDLVRALQSIGADIKETNGCPPLHIHGTALQGGNVSLAASKSSQYLTSLLLLGSVLPKGISVHVEGHLTSASYVDLTLKTLADFGIETKKREQIFSISPQKPTSPTQYEIEGDWSAAGAFLVLQEITGSDLALSNLNPKSEQGDALVPTIVAVLREPGPKTIQCEPFPDQVMNLAVLAAARTGTTRLLGAKNLRIKECDRLAVTAAALQACGVQVTVLDDGLEITGTDSLKPAHLLTAHDHRMAMCFAVLGSLCRGITIDDKDCVRKSYPGFWHDLELAHQQSVPVAIIGMRGVGKTHLAKRLASKLKKKFVDTDTLFVQQHGVIADYVATHGWPAFRAKEAELVSQALEPGNIVSLGGGAIETEAVQKVLQEKALCVWLEISEADSVARLQKIKRPALTNLPLEQEVKMILGKRNPIYSSLADIRVPATLPFGGQVPYVIRQLRRTCSW